MFERYVNFEFYKTEISSCRALVKFERYVNFEFYKTKLTGEFKVEEFERYVNFEFYKTDGVAIPRNLRLRDM